MEDKRLPKVKEWQDSLPKGPNGTFGETLTAKQLQDYIKSCEESKPINEKILNEAHALWHVLNKKAKTGLSLNQFTGFLNSLTKQIEASEGTGDWLGPEWWERIKKYLKIIKRMGK
jgi:hypothetical protein